jgi:hypothetical protein
VKQCAFFSKTNVTHHCKTWVCPEMYLTLYYYKALTWRKMYFAEHCKTWFCCEIHWVKVLWSYVSDYRKEWTFCKITAVITSKRKHAVKLHQWFLHRINVLWNYISYITAQHERAVKLLQWLPQSVNVPWNICNWPLLNTNLPWNIRQWLLLNMTVQFEDKTYSLD